MHNVFAQNVAINSTGALPNASAMLDLSATDKGLLIPRVTLCQRTTASCVGGMLDGLGNLPAAAPGLLVFQTDAGGEGVGFYYNTSATTTPSWVKLLAGSGTGGIYAGSGSLTVDPTTVTMGANNLTFTSTVVDGFSVDGSTFSIDALNNRVGIGTVTPGAKLEISGGASNTIKVMGSGGAPSWQARVLIDRTNEFRGGGVWIDNSGGTESDWFIGAPYNGGSASGGFTIGYHATQPEYIANSFLRITNTGNVGIGTTSPSTKLDVVGVLELSNVDPLDPGSDIVRLGDGGTNLEIQTNYGYTRIGPQNTGWSHFSTDRPRFYFDRGITVDQGLIGSYNEDLSLQTSGTTRITVLNADGKVGIGIAIPVEELDVVGDIKASGIAYWGSSGTRTETKNDAGALGGRSGYYQTSAPAPPANWPTGAGSWWHLLEARHSNLTNNYAMQFAGSFFDQDFWVRKTNNSATTAWAQLITTANISSYGDNLGNHIATQNLNMSNFEIDNITFADITAGNGNGIRFWSSNSYAINMGNAAEFKYGAVTDYSIKTNMNNSAIRGWTWGIDGIVPIASINTEGKLSLANFIQIDGNVVIDDAAGWHRSYGNTGWQNATYGGGLYMIDATWIRTSGNKSFYHNTGTMRTDGTLQVGGSGATLNVPNNGNFSYRTSVLFANTAGNVGVGTAAPNVKLHVEAGDVRINASSAQGYPDLILSGAGTQVNLRNDGARLWTHSNAAASMQLNVATNYSNDLGFSIQYTPGTIGAVAGRAIIGQFQKNNVNFTHGITSFYTNGLERIRIASTGNVGIGTTAPGAKLEVAGQVKITGGTPAAGQVLTSDASGLATWEPPGAPTLNQGMTRAIATNEVRLIGNNSGSFSACAGCGYTVGTWISVTNMSVARTITAGNPVQVTFSGRIETDDVTYWAPEQIFFRILRDGVEIARTAVSSRDPQWNFTTNNVSLTVYDSGAGSGSKTYSVQCHMVNGQSGTESFFIGERYLTITEIKP